MPKFFLAPEGEVAKPTGGGECGAGSAAPQKHDAFRGQSVVEERIKTARKVCAAPTMDWTDESHPVCSIKHLRSAENRVSHFVPAKKAKSVGSELDLGSREGKNNAQ